MDVNIDPGLLHKGSADDVLIKNPGRALPYTFLAHQQENVPPDMMSCYGKNGQGDWQFSLTPAQEKQGQFTHSEWSSHRGLPYQIVEQVRATHGSQALSYTSDGGQGSTSLIFHNSADHYYFYRKMHEHVPGVMLIEAARQAVYYQLYTTTDHICGQVTLSLNALNSQFYTYADLMYPIELVVDDIEPGTDRQPKRVYYRVALYQRGVLLAIIDTQGTVIKIDQFSKIRNAFFPEHDWFTPLDPRSVSIELVTDVGESHQVELLGITTTGCLTHLPPSVDPRSICRMNLVMAKKLTFSAELVPTNNADASQMHWQFSPLARETLSELKEIIKRGFILMANEKQLVTEDAQ